VPALEESLHRLLIAAEDESLVLDEVRLIAASVGNAGQDPPILAVDSGNLCLSQLKPRIYGDGGRWNLSGLIFNPSSATRGGEYRRQGLSPDRVSEAFLAVDPIRPFEHFPTTERLQFAIRALNVVNTE
jgi:hypothetical protein